LAYRAGVQRGKSRVQNLKSVTDVSVHNCYRCLEVVPRKVVETV
jgi:hypothetical protein